MPLNVGMLGRMPRGKGRQGLILFKGFSHGLNTALPAFQLGPTELSKCINWKFNKGGQQETRSPVVQYTDTAIGIIKAMADVPIGSTTYKLLTDADYNLYYLDGLTPTLIGTLEGETQIMAYNGFAVLLDGSYVKYLEDASSIKMAYDSGTGTSGFQFNYTADQAAGSLKLGDGSNTKIGQKFVTQSWDLGYTIPPISFAAYLAKEGNPTGTIVAKIYKLSDDSVIATKDFISDTTTLTTVATSFNILFENDDITEQLLPSREDVYTKKYRCSLEYSNSDVAVKNVSGITKADPGVVGCVGHGYVVGDAVAFSGLTEMTELNDTSQTVTVIDDDDNFSINDTSGYGAAETTGGDCVQKKATDNCVRVYYTDVDSAGLAYNFDGLFWVENATKNCLMSLSPGRPPKGSYGTIRNERIWIAGDPDNPGYAWFGNLSHFDWSSINGGGYVGAVDDNSNNYPVGGLANLFGDLYVYGQESQPYLCKLTGSSPSEYVLSRQYQRIWALPKTVQNAVNDLWTASKDGVDALSGVQEYGDIRTFSYSDPIEDRINDYWTANAIAGYYSKDGQYWLYMPGHHRVLICHTKIPVLNFDQIGMRYPWSEYEFCKAIYATPNYQWTASSSGTNEYYCEGIGYYVDEDGQPYVDEDGEPYVGSGDPSITNKPDYMTLDNKKISEGTLGSLGDHQWTYGDNDGLGYSTVYVRDDSGDPDVTEVEIKNVFVPTCFGTLNNEFMFGSAGGFVYKLDTTEYKDLTINKIYFDTVTPFMLFPLTHVNLNHYQINAFSKGGSSIDISFYRDEFQDAANFTFTKSLMPDDRLRVEDFTMDVGDMTFPLDTTTVRKATPMWRQINMNARSIQVRINNVTLGGYPLFLNEQTLRYRGLSY